ncbi:Y4yA family PLP-dependent enzyme [Nocardia sp. NBC_01327]|uniref:Y4yA family PLP-dependent enzyme n=1 Tax=Nocardia sp. NBC_01327 TaxID=2903593 RepID=UPI002E15E6F0|nr:Y4yA family PLP-dependent enzyme [Nocardia sp. NBC_01327]
MGLTGLQPGLSTITAAPMPAYRDDWEQRLLAHPTLLRDIAESVGGPFHLMYPARVAANIAAFQQVFAGKGVVGAIYYGKKANKSPAVVRVCAENGAGVDVSSAGEFRAALAGGVLGRDLMVTGPAKSTELLVLAVRHRALVAIDDLDELARLSALGSGDSARGGAHAGARALLRVLPPGSASRFGMTGDELDLALTLIDADSIRLEGFSFHLRGYEVADRAALASMLITRCREARGLGHPVTTLSIGGGFGVDYVPAAAWDAFRDGVNPYWFHSDRAPQSDSYYPYHCPVPGPEMLAAILDYEDLGDRLRAAGIRIAIEPGRALLDRAGSTVFQVQGTKTRTAHGHPYHVLTVNGTSLSLSEQWFDSEYLPDPVLWPQLPGSVSPTCVGGSSCLEEDMLSWRRIPLPRPAATDDLLIYPNTAGYQMDSNESAFHDQPIPPKVVLHNDTGERNFEWELDSPT